MSIEVSGEGTVSGNQVSIPAGIRRRLDIEDGDTIRWEVVDGELTVEVCDEETGVFDDFDPGSSGDPVDGVSRHDRFGIE